MLGDNEAQGISQDPSLQVAEAELKAGTTTKHYTTWLCLFLLQSGCII